MKCQILMVNTVTLTTVKKVIITSTNKTEGGYVFVCVYVCNPNNLKIYEWILYETY